MITGELGIIELEMEFLVVEKALEELDMMALDVQRSETTNTDKKIGQIRCNSN